MNNVQKAFEAFREYVHEHTPDGYRFDMRRQDLRTRVLCGEHGRLMPYQGSCPKCGGIAEETK
jgi:hypothetical protein